MSDAVISVENLSKLYRLGSIGTSTLREDLSRGWARLRGRADPTLRLGAPEHPRQENGDFWALRDINFEVRQGEVLGIVGANGAGKSTLLKILSRITAPTFGEVKLKGRVASLLEVGTGFHQDLSGRENVFLNGAILGMSKAEIRRKLDEIVAFAGLDEFIDTPVKRYSSGMYVRLAFAVAAHLDPEILILDEVLAVGDAQFQRKCVGKMDQVARDGRTVLLVSHNLTVVASLCRSAILLDNGAKVIEGPVKQVLERYIGSKTAARAEVTFSESDAAANNGRLRLTAAKVLCRARITGDVEIDQPVTLAFDFEVIPTELNLCTSIHVKDKEGVCAFVSGTPTRIHARGTHRHAYTIPPHLMNDGIYTIDIFLITETTQIEVCFRSAVSFSVHETSGRKDYLGKIIGCVRPQLGIKESAL
jgi:lipopolysaccharide transport system ATP-binding protein